MLILRRTKKKRPTYKYTRVYFMLDGDTFYREKREDYFPIKKSFDKWFIKTISFRNDKDRRTYKYEKYETINVGKFFIEQFDNAFEKYIFDIREKKLKRLTYEQ